MSKQASRRAARPARVPSAEGAGRAGRERGRPAGRRFDLRFQGILIDVQAGTPSARQYLGRLRARAAGFLRRLDLEDVELSVLLTHDAGIRVLNREWRRKDRPTDVLSFPACSKDTGTTGLRHL